MALGLLLLAMGSSHAAGFRKRSFQESYREALELCGGGDSTAAAAVLVEAETRALAEVKHDSLARLRRAELKVVRELMQVDSEVLLPLSGLYEQAYLVYLERSDAVLISHSREMVLELAGMYARSRTDADGNVRASLILTSLAGYLQAAKVDSVAGGLFRQALVLDESNGAALMGLSFLDEQYGDYADALHNLESLVDVDRHSGAARLRLGVMYVRLGREEVGSSYLREALNPEYPPWVRSVAYQELGRVLLDRGQLEEARTLLETGVRELPADPNLLIQLAYLSERNGFYSQDPALQQALRGPSTDGAIGSPRYRYSQMPTEALVPVRRELAILRQGASETLAQALAEHDGRKGVD